jgi:hypothetical protein
MEIRAALDQHVRKRLEDTFGKAVAMLIWASAHGATGISSLDPDRDGYLRLVDAICCDQRVVDMWGRSGTEHTLREWRELV